MKLFRFSFFHGEFDFRLAGRWLFLGSIVGVLSGLGAILFQMGLVFLRQFVVEHLMGLEPIRPGGESYHNYFNLGHFNPWLIIILPALGGLIAGFLVFQFAPEAEGHGTDDAINSFHRKRGIMRPIVPIIKLLASIITIGSGGSGGREGPIAQIGAGVGSFLATRLGLDIKTRRWLLAAGVGAGIGSIFRAPLAGALFAAEVLYSSAEVETEVLLPALVSTIIAYSVFSMKFGWGHMFTDAGMHGFTNALDLIPYSIEALLLAFMAFLFVKTFYGVKDLFNRWNIPDMIKPFFGGLITGAIALALIEVTGDRKFVIDVLGGGYGILQEILHNDVTNLTLVVLVLVAFGKILTTSFTISSGGSAGVFGPSMVIGGTIGAATGYIMQYIFPGLTLYPSTFAIVGMAGFFAAAANTPISTIIMVSELTGNYELLLPSMWVCSIAYLVAKKKWSIYKSQVPSKIYSQAHFGEFAPDIFETTTVEETYKKTRHFITIPSHWNMEMILKMASDTSQRIFPVVDRENVLQGTFSVSDVTHLLQAENGTSKTAQDIMHKSVLEVHPYETIRKAQQILQENQVEELLVIDDHENPPKILGIITAADIMTTYNKKLSRIKFGSDTPERLPEDKSVLNRISVNNVLETDLLTIEPDACLGDLVKIIIRSKRNIFPVVDAKLKFYGIIMLNDIREVMFDTAKYETEKIKDLMAKSPAIVNEIDSMSRVMEKFEKTGAWNLPVIDRYHRFKGLVSKSTIFSVYRRQLLRQAEV